MIATKQFHLFCIVEDICNYNNIDINLVGNFMINHTTFRMIKTFPKNKVKVAYGICNSSEITLGIHNKSLTTPRFYPTFNLHHPDSILSIANCIKFGKIWIEFSEIGMEPV